MAVLKPLFGRGDSKAYELGEKPCCLGRAPDGEIHDLFAGFSAVSRRHAKITFRDGAYHIEDTRSRNGTWVNGQRLMAPRRLQHGDCISIGGIELVFLEDQDDSPLSQFTDADSESAISKTVGLNALLEQGVLRADFQLRAMVEMLDGLRGSLDVQAVMDRVLAALLQIFEQADEAFVGLGDSLDKPKVAAVRFRDEATRRCVHVSRTVVGRALRSKIANKYENTTCAWPG